MGIKDLKPVANGRYKQGYYVPVNKLKYIGKNPKIIYRSGLEKKFCRICDLNDNVICWSSEEHTIKYFNPIDEKIHNYYPDFYLKVSYNGNIFTWLIEIKANSKLQKPKKPSKYAPNKSWDIYYRNLKEFIIINAKKKAAEAYCEKYDNMEYHFLTEKSWLLKRFS